MVPRVLVITFPDEESLYNFVESAFAELDRSSFISIKRMYDLAKQEIPDIFSEYDPVNFPTYCVETGWNSLGGMRIIRRDYSEKEVVLPFPNIYMDWKLTTKEVIK